MVGGWEPHGARISHVLIFVIRPLRPDKNTWQPRSMGRGVWEGMWLAGYSWLDYGKGGCAGLMAGGLAGVAGADGLAHGWLRRGGSKSGCGAGGRQFSARLLCEHGPI